MDKRGESGGDADLDPREFLRALLKINREDAETARENSPATRKRGGKGQGGPTADYGRDRQNKRDRSLGRLSLPPATAVEAAPTTAGS
jgi:hypothetical protein